MILILSIIIFLAKFIDMVENNLIHDRCWATYGNLTLHDFQCISEKYVSIIQIIPSTPKKVIQIITIYL